MNVFEPGRERARPEHHFSVVLPRAEIAEAAAAGEPAEQGAAS